MEAAIIQKRVNDLAAAMLAKGMRAPSAELWVKSDAEPTVYLKWEAGIRDMYGLSQSKFLYGNFAEVLDDAAAFIAKQDDAEQTKLKDFLSALGTVIDIGKQHGIEADYLNPLVASMKKLSKNIIADQRAA